MQIPFLIQHPMFLVELVYSLIVIISCGIIYFRTKSLYYLSAHKGIKYFSSAFLFFGIAFFARLILRLIAISKGPSPMDFMLFYLGFFLFLYASFMAGFYLIYSSIWKNFKNSESLSLWSHPLALSIAAVFIIAVFDETSLIMLGITYLLAAILAYHYKSEAKKKGNILQIHILYILLFLTLVLNGIAHIFIRISGITSIALYGVSSIIFLTILYRVMRSTRI